MIEILHKEDCCGCNACVQRCPQQCISMHEDEEGFLYPHIDQTKCINCNLCNRVCPVLNQEAPRQPLQIYAAKNTNLQIRRASSSGGIFTLLAEQILKAKGVVFGARFNKNWEVVHDYTDTIDELAAFRGSKYSQSNINTSFLQAEKFLKESRIVLFSGTPCQIAGLKHFLHKDYPNLLTVEVVCHGVPSPAIWRKYLKSIIPSMPSTKGIPSLNQSITSIAFRDKQTGWDKYSLVIKGHGSNDMGQTITDTILLSETVDHNSYLQGFIHDLYLRPSCYSCPSKSFKSGSDITIADFWGIKYYHATMDDNLGVSAVLINTQKGLNHWKDLEVNAQQTRYSFVLRGNPAISQSSKRPSKRASFFKQIDSVPFDDLVWKCIQISYTTKFKAHIKTFMKKIGLLTLIRKIAQ